MHRLTRPVGVNGDTATVRCSRNAGRVFRCATTSLVIALLSARVSLRISDFASP